MCFCCLVGTQNLFKVLAGLFELFVFCYIGSSLFLQTEKYNIFGYTVRPPRHVLTGLPVPTVTLSLSLPSQRFLLFTAHAKALPGLGLSRCLP